MKKDKLIQYILIVQGLFYLLTGWWAYLNMDSFLRFSSRTADPFKTLANAGLFIILGFFFTAGAVKDEWRRQALILGLASAAVTAVAEIAYFSQIKNTPFLLDLFFELVFAVFYIVSFTIRDKNHLPIGPEKTDHETN